MERLRSPPCYCFFYFPEGESSTLDYRVQVGWGAESTSSRGEKVKELLALVNI